MQRPQGLATVRGTQACVMAAGEPAVEERRSCARPPRRRRGSQRGGPSPSADTQRLQDQSFFYHVLAEAC